MLSRAAERVYWTGRYLERAENAARLVQQYSQLLLDLPEEAGVEWSELVRIVGAAAEFRSTGKADTENDVLYYLLAESDSPSSLASSLRSARENVRNTRDLLPQESWENVNELYQDARQNLPLAARGENRFEVLAEIIGRCQQIDGILTGTMSHLSPYHLLVLGQSLERADMTSRVIDVASAYIRANEDVMRRYGSSLWTNVLKSVSGFQMYRQYCQPQVQGSKVVDFLLQDTAFPRAVAFCVEKARESVRRLPRSDATLAALDDVEGLLEPVGQDYTAETISALMDTLQKRLGGVHAQVVDTWFLPDGA